MARLPEDPDAPVWGDKVQMLRELAASLAPA
jgi:hypothetical protein